MPKLFEGLARLRQLATLISQKLPQKLKKSQLSDLFRLVDHAPFESSTSGHGVSIGTFGGTRIFLSCYEERSWKEDPPHLWAGIACYNKKSVQSMQNVLTSPGCLVCPTLTLSDEHTFWKSDDNWAFKDTTPTPDQSELVLEDHLTDGEGFLGFYRFDQEVVTLGDDAVDLATDFLLSLKAELKELEVLKDRDLMPTQKNAVILARRGQGVFRSAVAQIEPKCRVTGVSDPRLLNASHIKPWSECANDQRLDGNNGLLLTPTVDRLFDRGLLSFEDDGRLAWSPHAWPEQIDLLNLPTFEPRTFNKDQKRYLKYHRQHIFKK